MYVTADERFAFIAHPRTASRATARAIGLPYFKDTGHHLLEARVCRQVEYNGGIVACTIRNPFDLAVSWFYNEHFSEEGRRKNGEFDQWIKKTGLLHNQWLEGKLYHYGLPHCNHVMRFETLEADLRELCEMTGRHYVETKPYGVLPRDRDYRVYYNDESRAIVADRFAADLAKTGYQF